MLKRFIGLGAVAVVAIAGCAQTRAPQSSPSLSDPLPPPRALSSGPAVQAPGGGPLDIYLRGAAFAASGNGQLPPDSQMTVRIFDAAGGDPSDWVAEQSYIRSGGLPWPYGMEFRTEAIAGLQRPAIAAQIAGPDGRLIYRSERPVPLVPGGSEDIPMVPVAGGGVAAATTPGAYIGAPVKPTIPTTYGIPDYNVGYGTPTYDNPVYPGQSYQPPTLSGPPSNGVF